MAKLTVSGLTSLATSYVAAASQVVSASDYSYNRNNLYALINKIGAQVTLKGDFSDKLPEFDGEFLPAGKTIEEYMIDLVLPVVYTNGIATEANATTEGAKDIIPQYPTVENACYSLPLGRLKTKTTRPYNYIEDGAMNPQKAGELVADIMWSFEQSDSIKRYYLKKALLGNFATKAISANLYSELSAVSDTSTGEAFLKKVKEDVEAASFAGESRSLSGTLIGAAPKLVLYILKGVKPSLDVDTMAGAFHEDKLNPDVEIKVLDDFGGADSSVFAILLDPRGIKLHPTYRAIRESENADGDFINFVRHEDNTGFISNHTYIKVYKTA